MKTYQKSIKNISEISELNLAFSPDLVLLFVSPDYKNVEDSVKEIKLQFPTATIAGCSTSGEIIDTNVDDNSLVINALQFERTDHKLVYRNIEEVGDGVELGRQLIRDLHREDLKHVLVFSDGLGINGDELVEGLSSEIDSGIGMTGGLAGDGTDFSNTFIIRNDQVIEGEVVAVGFYGSALRVGYSSQGGWDSFGIERKVTKSENNILYEIDGQPALKLYKSFLGEKAEELPGSGLLFPLSMRTSEDTKPLVRTLLSVCEEDQSITFAGNIPLGSYVRLMKANVDRLINGAESSAQLTQKTLDEDAEFALLVSCVGRRIVLKQLVEEEVEVVREVLGERPVISGFYSYGELAPFSKFQPCQLHNQTMTITTFSESA